MKKGIKEKDIRDFEKYAKKLSDVVSRIREYKGSAHIYATPGELNLMADEVSGYHGRIPGKEEDQTVISVSVSGLETGDW